MIFSVFDHNARCFDYYEAPGTSANYGARGTKYRPLTQAPQAVSGLGGMRPGDRLCIGYVPEALAMTLPARAMPVGRGEKARGTIAVVPSSRSRSLSGLGDDARTAQPIPPTVVVNEPRSVPFERIVAASCIAAVVGVVVQRLLTK